MKLKKIFAVMSSAALAASCLAMTASADKKTVEKSADNTLGDIGVMICNLPEEGYPYEITITDAKFVGNDGNEITLDSINSITEAELDPEGNFRIHLRAEDKLDEDTGDVVIPACPEMEIYKEDGTFKGGTLSMTIDFGAPPKQEEGAEGEGSTSKGSGTKLSDLVYPSETDTEKNDGWYSVGGMGFYMSKSWSWKQGDWVGINDEGKIEINYSLSEGMTLGGTYEVEEEVEDESTADSGATTTDKTSASDKTSTTDKSSSTTDSSSSTADSSSAADSSSEADSKEESKTDSSSSSSNTDVKSAESKSDSSSTAAASTTSSTATATASSSTASNTTTSSAASGVKVVSADELGAGGGADSDATESSDTGLGETLAFGFGALALAGIIVSKKRQ